MASLLVLGGTSFVGRAVVSAAQSSGHRVATLNRGRSAADAEGVLALRADRDDAGQMARALSGHEFDAAIDVSARAPRQVRIAAETLGDSVAHYGVVSSVSVYRGDTWGSGTIDEDTPTVAGDPDDDSAPALERYAEQKRGGELAALRVFGADRLLIARPTFVLGPHENMGRVPYWLGRAAAGGVMIGPGTPHRAFPYVDVDDLAAWLVAAVASGRSGVFNAANAPTRDTWADWLAACQAATGVSTDIRWIDDGTLLDRGVVPHFGLPLWIPGGLADLDTGASAAAGFTGRPLSDTVAAAWSWMRSGPDLSAPTGRPRPISRATELEILQST